MSKNEVFLKPTRMRTHPHTTRSRLMLEVACELVNRRDWPYLQARISLREQGAAEWPLALFASDSPATLYEVAAKKVQFAIINPGMILKLAAMGGAPFKQSMPLRIMAVLPSCDQMVFAVKSDTGLNSFSEIRERRFPLKVSLRGQPDHSFISSSITCLPPRVLPWATSFRGAEKSDTTPAWPTEIIASAPCTAVRFTRSSTKAPAPGAIWRLS